MGNGEFNPQKFLKELDINSITSRDEMCLDYIVQRGENVQDRIDVLKVLGQDSSRRLAYLRQVANNEEDLFVSGLATLLLEDDSRKGYDAIDSLLGAVQNRPVAKVSNVGGSFEYLPESKIWISSEPVLRNYSPDESIKKLHERGFFMPDISQFKEFLMKVEGGEENSELSESFYREVYNNRVWLNAKAKEHENGLIVSSSNPSNLVSLNSRAPFVVSSNENERSVDYLDWISEENYSGLPEESLGEGDKDLRYIPFQDGLVATFSCGGDGPLLDCSSQPTNADSNIVYACKLDQSVYEEALPSLIGGVSELKKLMLPGKLGLRTRKLNPSDEKKKRKF
jgi:hypothetical protein